MSFIKAALGKLGDAASIGGIGAAIDSHLSIGRIVLFLGLLGFARIWLGAATGIGEGLRIVLKNWVTEALKVRTHRRSVEKSRSKGSASVAPRPATGKEVETV